jgi:hypothetical protein
MPVILSLPGTNGSSDFGYDPSRQREGHDMECIWLKRYPATDIDVTQYSALLELLEERFAKFRDRKF